MNKIFKILILIAFSVFTSTNTSAGNTFSITEKQSVVVKKTAVLAPVIVAHYASETGNIQTTSDLIQTAVDLGSLAIPGGQMKLIGKVFYYADKISSLASIAGTFNREDNSELAQLFNHISMATGGISLAELTNNGYKILLKRKAENFKQLTTAQVANDLDAQATETLQLIANHPEQLKQINTNELADILEAEKKALGTNCSPTQTANIDNAINGLRNLAEGVDDLGGLLVKDAIPSNILNYVSIWDNTLGELVQYPKYNNVALGKASGNSLEVFGNNVGANVWTSSTHPVFTKKYALPDSWTFERSIKSVFDETIGSNQGKILFDINGGLIHNPTLVMQGYVTELELQILLRNQGYLDNVIFHNSGTILSNTEILNNNLSFISN